MAARSKVGLVKDGFMPVNRKNLVKVAARILNMPQRLVIMLKRFIGVKVVDIYLK